MKKAELESKLTKVMSLVEQLQNLDIDKFQDYLDDPSIQKIMKRRETCLRQNQIDNTDLYARIIKLPEETYPKTPEFQESQDLAKLLNGKENILNTLLADFSKLSTLTDDLEESLYPQIQQEYNALIAELDSLVNPMQVDARFSQSNDIQTRLAALNDFKHQFTPIVAGLNRDIAMAKTNTDKKNQYKVGIMLLREFRDTHGKLLENLEKRMVLRDSYPVKKQEISDKIKQIESILAQKSEKKVINYKNISADTGFQKMQFEKVITSKGTLEDTVNSLRNINQVLNGILQQLGQQVSTLDKAQSKLQQDIESQKNAFFAVYEGFKSKMEQYKVSKEGMAKLRKFEDKARDINTSSAKPEQKLPLWEQINKDLIAMVQEVDNKVFKVEDSINQAIKAYKTDYESLQQKKKEYPGVIEQAQLDQVQNAKQWEDEFNLLKTSNERLAFVREKHQKLNTLLDKVDTVIRAHLIQNIETLNQFILTQYQTVQEKKLSYLFSGDETQHFELLDDKPFANWTSAGKSIAQLSSELNQLIEKQPSIQSSIRSAEVQFTRHDKAKSCITNINDFIKAINDNDKNMIAIIHKYLGDENRTQFFKDLNKALLDHNPDKQSLYFQTLTTVSEFIQDYEKTANENTANIVSEIKKNIAFIDLFGTGAGDLQGPYSSLISPLLEIKQVSEDDKNSFKKVLADDNKIKALYKAFNILKAHGLDKSLPKLITNPKLCDVIVQQAAANEGNKAHPLAWFGEEHFKKLLEHTLNMEPEHIRIIQKTGKLSPNFCQPWFLVYATHPDNSFLIETLSNNDKFRGNVLILESILDKNKASSRNMMARDWFSTEDRSIADNAVNAIVHFKNEFQSTDPKKPHDRLQNLRNANALDTNQFTKIATLIHELNMGIDNYCDAPAKKITPETRQKIQNYKQSAVNLILSKHKHSLENIEQDLKVLAQRHFRNHYTPRLVIDIMQIVTGAFAIVIPIRLLAGKRAFFSAKKSAEKNINQKVRTIIEQLEAPESAEKKAETNANNSSKKYKKDLNKLKDSEPDSEVVAKGPP